MFKKVYSLYSAFCTQPAFYSQSAVCILHSVCILPLVRSLQSAVRSLRFTLTERITIYDYSLSSVTKVVFTPVQQIPRYSKITKLVQQDIRGKTIESLRKV